MALSAVEKPTDELVIAWDNVLEFSFGGFIDYYRDIGHSCIVCYTEPDVAKQRRTGIITINKPSNRQLPRV